MAKQVLLAAYVALGGTDYSDHISKAELSVEVEDKESTTFGSSGWKEVLGGIKSAELSLTFKQDVAASNVDSVFFALLGSTTTFEIRLSNSAVGASNPKYTGTVLVNAWSPINGSVGDLAEVEVGWPTTGAVTRATS
jgi:predicted secreted protein